MHTDLRHQVDPAEMAVISETVVFTMVFITPYYPPIVTKSELHSKSFDPEVIFRVRDPADECKQGTPIS